MNLLLDTHALLWFLTDSPKLPNGTRDVLKDMSNPTFVSMVSLWEIALKHSLGRLELHEEPERFFQMVERSGFKLLHIEQTHILSLTRLPLHHQDPFDRLLIAQGQCENLTIVSKDRMFSHYDVRVFWD
jgi:PIN domain nuclease of toxin-antitoxin system